MLIRVGFQPFSQCRPLKAISLDTRLVGYQPLRAELGVILAVVLLKPISIALQSLTQLTLKGWRVTGQLSEEKGWFDWMWGGSSSSSGGGAQGSATFHAVSYGPLVWAFSCLCFFKGL